jgi:hypothetical protein
LRKKEKCSFAALFVGSHHDSHHAAHSHAHSLRAFA